MSQFKKVSLSTIGMGAAVELFDKELATVLSDIADINTPAKEMRKIVLEVSILPTENRDMGVIELKCRSKVAGTKPFGTSMFFAREGGKLVAYSNDPKQEELFAANVRGIKVEGEVTNA
jgi:hypothetical protein